MSIVLVASALAAAAPPASAASTLIVCPTVGGACTYTSIQAAIDDTLAGDTVVVRPGTYAENLLIDESITVCSTGATGTACNPNAAGVKLDTVNIYPVFISAPNVMFQGFTIDNADYTTVDVDALTKVDVSAIVVAADNVVVRDNVIAAVASEPLPGQSRWYTVGINIGAAAAGDVVENVEIIHNTMQTFPRGYSGTCMNAPCAVQGISNWDEGAGFRAHNNDIRMGGASEPAHGIQFDNNDNAIITSNFIRMPSSQPGGAIAIDAGVTDGAQINANDIATTLTSTPGGLYGIWGIFTNTEFVDNKIQLAHHGIVLRSSMTGGNLVEDNEFLNSNQGVLNYANNGQIIDNLFDTVITGIVLDHVDAPGGPYSSSENVVIRDNTFRQYTTSLLVTATVSEVSFDARENDWGAYTAENIRLRISDEGTDNEIDISCFIDNDGTTRVCPIPSFTAVPSGTSWPRTVTLTDTSACPGSECATREWTLPGGATSTESPVVLTLGPGAYSADLEVTDGEGFTASVTNGFILSNAAPAFDLADDYPASEGALLSLALGATDTDGDTLTYTLVSGPPGAEINNGVLEWTPTATQSGAHTVTISVTDGAAPVSDTTTINVANVPVGPVFDPVANLNLLEGASGSRAIKATHGGGGSIVLTKDSGPGTLAVNGNGLGTLSYTAPPGSSGTYPVVINATADGITTQLTFNIIVTSSVGVQFSKVTASNLQTTPGATVQLTGTIKNTGTGTDAFKVTAVSTKTGWTIGSVADVPLASGASASVTVPVTLPASGDTAFITVKVCSIASPTTCQTQKWRVDVPIFITIVMDPSFGLTDTPQGTVVVTYLNSAVAEGVAVIVTESSDEQIPLFESQTQGTTDPTGTYAFSFDTVQARLLGGHTVFVSAKRGDVQAIEDDAYDVTL